MGKYWDRICKLQAKQTQKGLEKYGQVLEDNKVLSPTEVLTYLQEELIDGLMYAEHFKELLSTTVSCDIYANEYQAKAMRTMSEKTLADPVLNGALGLAGESGEVADHVKKARFQDHTLDPDYIINELGDILWYVATTAFGLGVPLSDVMKRNIQKLLDRYPHGFEAERSINRKEEQK